MSDTIETLRSAITYAGRYHDAVFVIKFGGEAVGHPSFAEVVQDVVLLHRSGIKVILVHGAGPQIDTIAQRQGIELRKEGGIRLTDDMTMHIVKEVCAGITCDILACLTGKGLVAGGNINAVQAKKRHAEGGVDYGHTGSVEEVDAAVLERLLGSGVVPILSPIAYGRNGLLYNINADEVAVETALALQARKLIFLSNIDGLLGRSQQLVRELSVTDLQEELAYGEYITGGMIPKMRACQRACLGGVERCHIINYTQPAAILQEVFSSEGIGTMVHSDEYDRIRRATLADADALRILSATYLQPPPQPVSTLIEKNIGDFFLLVKDGHICAFCHCHEQEGNGIIDCLATTTTAADSAADAQRLLQSIKNNAASHGYAAIIEPKQEK